MLKLSISVCCSVLAQRVLAELLVAKVLVVFCVTAADQFCGHWLCPVFSLSDVHCVCTCTTGVTLGGVEATACPLAFLSLFLSLTRTLSFFLSVLSYHCVMNMPLLLHWAVGMTPSLGC